MAWTARRVSSNALYQGVNKTAHGFTQVGTIVRFNGTDFVAAVNTSEANAEVVGMISAIPNVDQFYVTQAGFVSGLTAAPVAPGGAFVPGTLYYLSSTSGALTATKPTTVGLVELPCFIAHTATSGFFFASVGTLIESGTLFNWNLAPLSATMSVNQGYLVSGGASINLQLPAASVRGDIIEIATLTTNGCVITMAVGQTVNIVDATSSSGGTVTLQTTNGVLSGSARLLCMVANTQWKMIGGTGVWNPA